MKKLFASNSKNNPQEMTLVEHLAELRRRVIVSIVAVTIGGAIAYVFYGSILNFFMQPLCQIDGAGHCSLYVTGPLEGFTWRVKISAFAGLLVALPVVMYQLWKFIAPGLHKHEKRYAIPFVVSSFILFLSGSLAAYLVFPKALLFLQGAAGPQIHALYTPQSYLGFIIVLMAAFGAAFEFPVVLVTLELLGVFTPSQLAKSRRWAIVMIFIAGAVLIPSSDPYSLFALTIPLVLFYELAILIGRVFARRSRV